MNANESVKNFVMETANELTFHAIENDQCPFKIIESIAEGALMGLIHSDMPSDWLRGALAEYLESKVKEFTS